MMESHKTFTLKHKISWIQRLIYFQQLIEIHHFHKQYQTAVKLNIKQ